MIGLLGGTFNPIHYGHLRIAEELSELMGFTQVRFIPAAHPPHKIAPEVSAEQRVEMVKLAITDNPRFRVDTLELERTGPSYTIDTLKALRKELGSETSLSLMMGTDAFARLDTWHDWQQLLQYAHIVLVERPLMAAQQTKPSLSETLQHTLQAHYTEHVADLQHDSNGHIIMQNVTWLDISATQIRQRLKEHRSIRYLLPEAVEAYIHQHHLYTD